MVDELVLLLAIFFVLASFFWVYYFLTRFETDITIKREVVKGNRSGRYNMNLIASEDGRIFQLQNHAFILYFDSSEVIVRLQPGKSYRVRGFGRRVPPLGMYPQITGIVKEY